MAIGITRDRTVMSGEGRAVQDVTACCNVSYPGNDLASSTQVFSQQHERTICQLHSIYKYFDLFILNCDLTGNLP